MGVVTFKGLRVNSTIQRIAVELRNDEKYSSFQKTFYLWFPFAVDNKTSSFTYKIFFVLFTLVMGGGALCVVPFIKEKMAQAYSCNKTCAIRVFLVPFNYIIFGILIAALLCMGKYYKVYELLKYVGKTIAFCMSLLLIKKYLGWKLKKEYRFDYFHKCKDRNEKQLAVNDFYSEARKIENSNAQFEVKKNQIVCLSTKLIDIEDKINEGDVEEDSSGKFINNFQKSSIVFKKLQNAIEEMNEMLDAKSAQIANKVGRKAGKIRKAKASLAKLQKVTLKVRHYCTEPFYKRHEYSPLVRVLLVIGGLVLLVTFYEFGYELWSAYNEGFDTDINFRFYDYIIEWLRFK